MEERTSGAIGAHSSEKQIVKTIAVKRIAAALLSSTLFTTAGFASTQATGTNTVSPTLVVNVTVAKAVQLTLATGSLGTTPCTVNAGSDYNISFGTVDALGISSPTCGAKFNPTTPGSTSAVYYADYQVTPMFVGQSVSTNTITAYVSANFTKTNLSIVQANSTPASIGSLTAMSTNSGSPTNIATNATNGTALTRYIGVAISPSNGSSLTGADSATVTYTMTVQ